jgi:hypothetical protein
MLKVFRVLSFVFLAAPSYGQSYEDVFRDLYDNYNSLQEVHIKLSIELYEDEDMKKLYYNEVADIRKSHDNYSCVFGSLEMLMNSRYMIMIDKATRDIVCSKRNAKAIDRFQRDPMKLNLDSLLGLGNGPKLIADTDSPLLHYRFDEAGGGIKELDIFIDQRLRTLSKLRYRYSDGHIVVITFSVFDNAPGFPENYFSEKIYFSESGSTKKLTDNYKGYTLTFVDGKK